MLAQTTSPLFPGHRTGPRNFAPHFDLGPSVSTRKLNFVGGRSMPGTLANNWYGRWTDYESLLERKCIMVCCATQGVVNVCEQPPSFEFKNSKGKLVKHTPDALVVFANGRREYRIIKPLSQAVRLDLYQTIQLMAPAVADRVHSISLMSEYSISPQDVDTAELYNLALRDPAPKHAAAVLKFVYLNGKPTVSEICAHVGEHAAGYWATIWLLAHHKLTKSSKEFITLDTPVWAAQLARSLPDLKWENRQ